MEAEDMPEFPSANRLAAVQFMNQRLDVVSTEQLAEDSPTEPLNADGDFAFKFLDEDPEFQRLVSEGGENPSAKVDKWATNRLAAFRKQLKLNLSVDWTQLPPAEIVALLVKFFERACKLSGARYPTESLMGLYRAFNRMLCRSQSLRVIATGVMEPSFSMRTCPMFAPVVTACVLAMKKSRAAGVNVKRKKAAVITLQDEAVILADVSTNPLCPRGLQRRTLYYLLCRFAM